jgi:hypothetical protein
MILQTKFGKIELTHSDAGLAPDKTGLQLNSIKVWFRLNDGPWIKSDFGSLMQVKKLIEIEDAANPISSLSHLILKLLNK